MGDLDGNVCAINWRQGQTSPTRTGLQVQSACINDWTLSSAGGNGQSTKLRVAHGLPLLEKEVRVAGKYLHLLCKPYSWITCHQNHGVNQAILIWLWSNMWCINKEHIGTSGNDFPCSLALQCSRTGSRDRCSERPTLPIYQQQMHVHREKD